MSSVFTCEKLHGEGTHLQAALHTGVNNNGRSNEYALPGMAAANTAPSPLNTVRNEFVVARGAGAGALTTI